MSKGEKNNKKMIKGRSTILRRSVWKIIKEKNKHITCSGGKV